MRSALAFVLLICPAIAVAQAVERLDVEVLRDGEPLEYPFAGGLEAPQLSHADLDRDGVPDLFLFDRAGYVQIPFLKRGGPGEPNYVIDWSVIEGFPEIPLWALMRDFNGDGVEDLFASTAEPGIQGIDVFRGFDDGDKLRFEKMSFDQGPFDLLYIEVGNGFTPMYSAWNDVPAIADVDADGDLDILTFDPGGSFLSYFRNLALEQGLGLDTLVYDLDDVCWGKFREDDFSEDILLSDTPDNCADAFLQNVATRHSGSASDVFDADGDGDMDLVLGDLGSAGITFLLNGGSTESAWMTDQVISYPSTGMPVDIPFFVAPFVVDVDGDGRNDLVAASNNDNFSENVDVLWYYSNNSSEDAPEFQFKRPDFLVGEMLDFGSDARPAIGDITGDGLADLLVGTGGYYLEGDRDPRLVLLRNIGTREMPRFEVADEDFLGFSAFTALPAWGFSPSVGDLDGDGDLDIVIGEDNGALFFCENTSGPGAPPVFAQPVYPFMDIDVGSASIPDMFDVNGDGLTDLVVGERLGNNDMNGKCSNLNYFQNTGQRGAPDFDPDPTQAPNTACFGGILFNPLIALAEYSAPVVFSDNGHLKLLVGSDDGQLRLYSGIEGNIYGEFDLVESDYGNVRDGFRIVPALDDLNADGFYEMLLGNRRGGLTLYRTDLRVDRTSTAHAGHDGSAVLFPNPASSRVNISWPGVNGEISMRITDTNGRVVIRTVTGGSLDISDLAAGAYFLELSSAMEQVTARLVVQR